jgi:hypothetical protein
MSAQHGISPTAWQHSVGRWLTDQLDDVEIRVRMQPAAFEQFVTMGRYTTQFERPGVSGGAKHLAIRTMLEHTVLGVPPSCDPRDRPVYGYLSGSAETFGSILQQYGPIVLHLHRHVLARATFTGADSLDFVIHQLLTEPAFAPAPVLVPSITAIPARDFFLATHGPPTIGRVDIDPLERGGFADLTSYGYAEAQIYGGLQLNDVREATATLGVHIGSQVLQRLSVSGVAWRTTAEAHP